MSMTFQHWGEKGKNKNLQHLNLYIVILLKRFPFSFQLHEGGAAPSSDVSLKTKKQPVDTSGIIHQ